MQMLYYYGPLTTISKLAPGTLFELNDGTQALKTEYGTGTGRGDCYIIGSGEALGSHISGDEPCRAIILYTERDEWDDDED